MTSRLLELLLDQLVDALQDHELSGRLWIVEPGRIRIHGSDLEQALMKAAATPMAKLYPASSRAASPRAMRHALPVATETKIKQLDLLKYRTIAFATRGVMAGEVKGIGESGLILTPPPQGSIKDDGTPGAEGLSGLGKAFFYAGARSLLVSHWPVAPEATVPLTTIMLKEYGANPGQGKAEAHRKAMMSLMASPDQPEYAHPIFRAPFVVAGEGGVSSTTR